MTNEKLLDYLDHFKNNHNNTSANIGAIICEQNNFPSILEQVKNDYILIEINNLEYKKQLEEYLSMRDVYRNFVLFFTGEILEKNIVAINKTLQNQTTNKNIKILFLSDTKNFDNLNLFNLTNSTCRI